MIVRKLTGGGGGLARNGVKFAVIYPSPATCVAALVYMDPHSFEKRFYSCLPSICPKDAHLQTVLLGGLLREGDGRRCDATSSDETPGYFCCANLDSFTVVWCAIYGIVQTD